MGVSSPPAGAAEAVPSHHSLPGGQGHGRSRRASPICDNGADAPVTAGRL